MNLAPILLFAYNRPFHLKRTLEALSKNTYTDESSLFIYSDAAKDEKDKNAVEEVREVIKNIKGFAKVELILRENNFGLANSVINGVTEIINKFGKVIVLEDDILTTPNFLVYMNEALEFYKNFPNVFSISGYSYPIHNVKRIPEYFFLHRASSWGWGTWKDKWEKTDWDVKDFELLKNDKNLQANFSRGGNDLFPMLLAYKAGLNQSWGIRWAYTHAKHDGVCLYSAKSKVQNIGADASGTHFTTKTKKFDVELDSGGCEFKFPNEVVIIPEINQSVKEFFSVRVLKRITNYFRFRKIRK